MADDDTTDAETQSAKTRYPYTNDVAALSLIFGSLCLLVAGSTGYADLSQLPQVVTVGLWIPTGLVATAWLFGGGAVKAASSLTGGKA